MNIADLKKGENYQVFLDGEEQMFCFAADEEAGEVQCYETKGPKGSEEIVCDYDEYNSPIPRKITRKGKVELRKVT